MRGAGAAEMDAVRSFRAELPTLKGLAAIRKAERM